MCTAISFHAKEHYFGRTLDLEYSYQEQVIITPRKYPLHFRGEPTLLDHHAFIGIATLAKEIALYYDGTNEYGLSIAALNFPGNACYHTAKDGCRNITHFEFNSWVLASFKTVEEVKEAVKNLNIIDSPFSDEYPVSPLHWIVSDKNQSIVVESVEDGIRCYANPYGVLTNNPPFPFQEDHLRGFLGLSRNEFADTLFTLQRDTGGTGLRGLPGDPTSKSRFVRAFFTKQLSVSKDSDSASVSQFFHIMASVSVTQGCVMTENDYVKTVYTSCCNTDKGIYYYTTYENNQITGVRLAQHNLNGKTLVHYPLIKTQQIRMENEA